MTAEDIAEATHCSIRGARIICDALCGLGILAKRNRRYSNNEVALRCLLPDSPEPKSAMLLHGARLYEKWGRLFDAVKDGKPVPEEQLDKRLDFGKKGFARAMQNTASQSAGLTAEALNPAAASRMLDLGGGPGLYTLECCRRNPSMQAFLLDDPEILEVARANIERAGMADRITLIPGDMFETPFPAGCDLILVSNVLHIYSAKRNRTLIEKCHRTLNPGGMLVIKDFFLDETRTNPVWSALFAVNMLVNTEEGDCYTFEEVENWLIQAGFCKLEWKEITPLSTAIVATRD